MSTETRLSSSRAGSEPHETSMFRSPVVIAAAGFVVVAVVTLFFSSAKGTSSADLLVEANLLRLAIVAFAFLAVLFASVDRKAAMMTIRNLKEQTRDAHERTRQAHTEQAALMNALDSLSEGVIEADVKGLVRFVNAAASRMTGVPNAEAVGHPIDKIARLFHSETNAKLPLPTVQALKEIAPVRPSRSTLMTRAGVATHVDAGASPLWADDQLVGVSLILTDVGQRLHAEEDLRARVHQAEEAVRGHTQTDEGAERRAAQRIEQVERAAVARVDAAVQHSAERIDALLRVTMDALILTDGRGIITDASPSAAQLLASGGLLPIKGRPLSTFLAAGALSGARDAAPRETTVCRADGSVIPVRASGVPLPGTGGAAVCLRDLTAQTAADARLRALEARTAQGKQEHIDLLQSLSDDLRGPLNGIIGYSEMLQEEAVEREVPDLVPDIDRIQAGGRHLLTLANDLLNLSKIESGSVDLYLQTFPVSDSVQSAANALRSLLEKGGSTLDIHCPSDLGSIYADPTKVQQSLVYSVSSFCKFTAHRTIALDAARESGNGEWITFRIYDAGHGGLESLTQTNAAPLDQRTDASGLAVAISRRFCLMMGGDVSVAVERGRGRVLTLRIPAEVVPPSSRAA